MSLEEILTSRHRLSEEILREVQESAGRYGVAIGRADVKDLIFPGNLQEIMNKVLAAERLSEAQLVEARTRAEAQRLRASAEVQALEERTRAQAYATHPAPLRLEELNTLRALAVNANTRLYLGFPKGATEE